MNTLLGTKRNAPGDVAGSGGSAGDPNTFLSNAEAPASSMRPACRSIARRAGVGVAPWTSTLARPWAAPPVAWPKAVDLGDGGEDLDASGEVGGDEAMAEMPGAEEVAHGGPDPVAADIPLHRRIACGGKRGAGQHHANAKFLRKSKDAHGGGKIGVAVVGAAVLVEVLDRHVAIWPPGLTIS